MTLPASQFADLVKVTTATTGTGTMTFGAALSGFVGTGALTDGALYSYAITDVSGAYEFGQGIYTALGTTLARTTVYGSSNSNTAINLSGTATVIITALKEDFVDLGRRRLLGKLIGADFNSTADQAITLNVPGASVFVLNEILITNASTSLTTAKGTFYAAASKTNIIPAGGLTTSPYTGLVVSTDVQSLIFSLSVSNTFASAAHFVRFTGPSTIYLSLTTAQGGAATADIYFFGYDLS